MDIKKLYNMATKIQQRRDTKAHWLEADPILSAGEEAYETDTYQRKIGDGTTKYSLLPYLGNPCLQDRGTSTTEAMSQDAVSKQLSALEVSVSDFLIDYGDALSNYGGSPAIDYGNANTVAIDF